jgi:pyruvate-formate lyase
MNERVKLLREESMKSRPDIFPFRALSITELYQETEGMTMATRSAKALEKILSEVPIIIRDHELIVGQKL